MAACSGEDKSTTAKQAIPVSIGVVEVRDVPVTLSAIGTVEASSTVEVKARVDGELLKVHFKEGDVIRAGDMLFTIDPAPYQTALREAESRLESEKAQTNKAEADLKRYEGLVKNKVISQSQYEEYATAAQVRRSSQAALAAEVETAKLRLSWCYIKAPLNGPTGSLYFHAGNLIKANNETPLVVIQQTEPIDVSFAVPEQNLSNIKGHMSQGRIKVEALIPGSGGQPETGKVTFVDNAVNTATGTIKLKAQFANEHQRLWPGQFVNITIFFTSLPNALTIPTQAIQSGPQGQYVYKVLEDNTVALIPVNIVFNFDKASVITADLQPGDQIVTEGQLRIIPGSTISIKDSRGNPE